MPQPIEFVTEEKEIYRKVERQSMKVAVSVYTAAHKQAEVECWRNLRNFAHMI